MLEATITLSEFSRLVSPEGGKPIHPATAWRWAKEGRLRVVNVGGRIFVPKSAVGEFLEAEAQRWRQKHSVPAPVRTEAAGDRAAKGAAKELGVEIKQK